MIDFEMTRGGSNIPVHRPVFCPVKRLVTDGPFSDTGSDLRNTLGP
jgi:hypothetical protein